jgi:antitoxin component HigA of HigAB toxin-antitoxin module
VNDHVPVVAQLREASELFQRDAPSERLKLDPLRIKDVAEEAAADAEFLAATSSDVEAQAQHIEQVLLKHLKRAAVPREPGGWGRPRPWVR